MKMKMSVLVCSLLLGSSGLALSQTAPTATTTGSPASTPTVAPGAPEAQNPGVNPNAAGTQMGTPRSGAATNSTRTTAGPANDVALSPGKNSFTEAQARRRIQDRGFTQIGQMHKDQNSFWVADAMKDGRRVHVGLDYKGNVAEIQQ